MGTSLLFVFVLIIVVVSTSPTGSGSTNDYSYEKDANYWRNLASDELKATLREPTRGVAKNVILFLGDGMGPTTVTAGRILAGQLKGMRGEENKLSFDKFPYTGLSRTYNTDTQVTDSAASGTAYLTGVKTNQGTLGVNANARRGNCASGAGNEVESILAWSKRAGKSAGFVTTTRVTHATPAASYAHIPERDWESDRIIPEAQRSENCKDIALQCVENYDMNVIMGGGRANFFPENHVDPFPNPKVNAFRVSRVDGRNLVTEWMSNKTGRGKSASYVTNKQEFDSVNGPTTDYLLGLFNQYHMDYDVDRDVNKEPSLAEMTKKAIEVLGQNDMGYFLLVEGGRIDHGHHDSQAMRALRDVVSFADAVEMADSLTADDDTLIVVTADHSHAMSLAGYAVRGNPILGISENAQGPALADDRKTYTTVAYGNGPGYTAVRANSTMEETEDVNFRYSSGVPLRSETHGGEDVAIYAKGPQSFLYTGVHEQNYIPIVMAYASCVGPYADGEANKCAKYETRVTPQVCDSATVLDNNSSLLLGSILISLLHLVLSIRMIH